MIRVEFTRDQTPKEGPYRKGDRGVFVPAVAHRLISLGQAIAAPTREFPDGGFPGLPPAIPELRKKSARK
jgi:hypothetical protein